MTNADPGPDYLEEAAEQLRLARAANEKRAARAAEAEAAGSNPGIAEHAQILAEVSDRRLLIAEGFIAIAAIREHMVTATGEYDARGALSALQRPSGEFRDDRGPGS